MSAGRTKVLVEEVLRRLKTVETASTRQKDTGKREPAVAVYRSFNPALGKKDIVGALPILQLGEEAQKHEALAFHVMKLRDPRFFTFRDSYLLRFPTEAGVAAFRRLARDAWVDDVQLRLEASVSPRTLEAGALYAELVQRAYESEAGYRSAVAAEGLRRTVPPLHTLDWAKVRAVEERSVLVWDVPEWCDGKRLAQEFWWYSIKNGFQLYSGQGRRLMYVAFGDPADAMRFKRNLHGSHWCGKQILVEKL
ncbi:AaceriADL133Cp [[Ashbya] aceris (nom. inval.)]|nr:AaceriADL133Cp [[Ashbya] aceris (nom. inval.)]